MSSSREADAKNARLFDVRTVDRNIKKGLVTRKDYDKYLKSLSDSTEKVAATVTDDATRSESADDADRLDADND